MNLLELVRQRQYSKQSFCSINSHSHSLCSVKPALTLLPSEINHGILEKSRGSNFVQCYWRCAFQLKTILILNDWQQLRQKWAWDKLLWWADTNSSVWITQLSVHQKNMTGNSQAKLKYLVTGKTAKWHFFPLFSALSRNIPFISLFLCPSTATRVYFFLTSRKTWCKWTLSSVISLSVCHVSDQIFLVGRLYLKTTSSTLKTNALIVFAKSQVVP